ncbi:MAG: hypothetical protein HUJ52_01425 [Malacoplasma sp.]|nr:hypothetical protein [Malacoplasma sp.]
MKKTNSKIKKITIPTTLGVLVTSAPIAATSCSNERLEQQQPEQPIQEEPINPKKPEDQKGLESSQQTPEEKGTPEDQNGSGGLKTPKDNLGENSDPKEKQAPEEVNNHTNGKNEDKPKEDDNKGNSEGKNNPVDQEKPAEEGQPKLQTHDVKIGTTEGGAVSICDESGADLGAATSEKSFEKADIANGTKIKIKVKPSVGFVFKGWNNDSLVTGNEQEGFILTTKDEDINLIALFAEKKYNVSIKAEKGGSIFVYKNGKPIGFSKNEDFNDMFAEGTELTIQASPDKDNDYKFDKWIGESTQLLVPVEDHTNWWTLTVGKSDIKLDANFIKESKSNKHFTLHIEKTQDGEGKYIIDDDINNAHIIYKRLVEDCDSLKVYAIPVDNHHVFSCWSDNITDNPRTIKVDKNLTLHAIFTEIQVNEEPKTKELYKVRVAVASKQGGAVSVFDENGNVLGSATYGDRFERPIAEGTKLNIVAVGDKYHEFDHWNTNVKDTDYTKQITVSKDTEFVAHFNFKYKNEQIYESEPIISTLGRYELYIPNTQNVKYKIYNEDVYVYRGELVIPRFVEGKKASLEAIPTDGSKFVKWSDGCTENPRDICLYKNETLFAITNKDMVYDNNYVGWDSSKSRYINVRHLTTTCNAVDSDSQFMVDDKNAEYSLRNKKYTDPITGDQYDAISIYDCGNYTDFGDSDQDPNTAALDFTTCQTIIDNIYKHPENIQKEYKDKEKYGKEKLGFVWAQNDNDKWQPFVVTRISEDAFNSKTFYNPVHCSVIIPWTVNYIGKKAFDDASHDGDTKLHVVFAERIGVDKNGNTFWEGVQQDNMDWKCDDTWDIKTTITYNAKENKWIYPTILSRHGEHEMAAIISKMLEK